MRWLGASAPSGPRINIEAFDQQSGRGHTRAARARRIPNTRYAKARSNGTQLIDDQLLTPATSPMKRPRGVTALSLFFWFGTSMAGLACLALLLPRSPLNRVWRLNPEAHSAFLSLGSWAVLLM